MRMIPCIAAATLAAVAASASAAAPKPDPIHELIFHRADTEGTSYPHMVDPPLWADSRFLLEGESHDRIVAALDELLSGDIEKNLPDAKQRALAQHELWQVFDWTLKNGNRNVDERNALRKRLARAIRRLALTRQQIEALPPNLSAPDSQAAPPPVTDEKQGWISLGLTDSSPIALAHVHNAGARSAFGVFLFHPDGPDAGRAFVARLASTVYPPTTQPGTIAMNIRAAMPQFSAGTKLALLRQMMLIDQNGEIVGSPITQSVQIRTFLRIEKRTDSTNTQMEEFTLDHDRYLSGQGPAWHVVTAEDRAPRTFMSKEMDGFEFARKPGQKRFLEPLVLRTCFSCHHEAGAASMLSYMRLVNTGAESRPRLEVWNFSREIGIAQGIKQANYSWGILRGCWDTAIDRP